MPDPKPFKVTQDPSPDSTYEPEPIHISNLGEAGSVAQVDTDGDVVNAAGDKLLSTSEANAAYAPLVASRPGNRCVFLGDSLTQWQDTFTSSSVSQRVSLANLGAILSEQRLTYIANAGIASNTTDQMLARFDTDVTPYAPDVVHILGGTNDTSNSLATTAANLTAIVEAVRGIGAVPIMGTVPPKSSTTQAERARLAAISQWVRQYAAGNGIAFVDYENALMDAATGGILSAYNGDNVHPNNAGFVLMAQALADALEATLPQSPIALPNNNNSDSTNLIANGLFTSGTSTGWTGSGPSGLTESFVDDAAIKGKWWQLAAAATASNTQRYQNLATAPVAGHRYALYGRIDNAWSSGANGILFRNRITKSDASTLDVMPINNIAATFAGVFYSEYTAPALSSSQQILFQIAAGTNTLKLAQLALRDLTALGLA